MLMPTCNAPNAESGHLFAKMAFHRLLISVIKVVASLSLVAKSRLRTISPISTIKGQVIEPVSGDLKLSIPRMKTIPEI